MKACVGLHVGLKDIVIILLYFFQSKLVLYTQQVQEGKELVEREQQVGNLLY